MTQVSDLQNLFQLALAHHQAGRLSQAEPIYQQILAAVPNQPDVLHLLGLLWHQSGRSPQGLELIARSVSVAPTFANLNNMGDVLRSLGRAQESINYFKRSIDLQPGGIDAHFNLALALSDAGRLPEAEKSLSRACDLAPQRADLFLRLCLLRNMIGDPHGAVMAGNRAVELAPNSFETWSNLAVALASAKKDSQGMEAAAKSIELGPKQAQVWHNLGYIHERAGRMDEAEANYKKALAINPNFSFSHRNLAALYDGRDQVPLSIEHLQRALSVQPQDPEGWVNLSSLRRRMKDYPGAVEAAEHAVRMKPNNPNAHGNLGLSLLAVGDYDRGFSEYEWRWRCDNFTSPQRDFVQPMWDGSNPTSRRIFVHSEQGYGDTIQFARFIPLLAARGATVYLEAVTYIKPLLATLQGVTRVVTAGTKPPEYDLQIPLLSLPRIFKTNAANIPNDVPYLRPDSERLARWKQRIDLIGQGMKVGLIWAGNVKPDASRTCSLSNFAPIANVKGVRFISLQKRDNPNGAEAPPAGMDLIDVSADLKDFAETAAAMMNLDLIITIDTSSAHLAGALGRPTWTLLPWAADWRWLSDREDSPWYPTMRLFRQQTKDEWARVIERVAHELGKARDLHV